MSYEFFLKNLDKFKPFEQIAQDRICSLFNTEILNVCCNKFYDFETTQNIKYEVTQEYSAESDFSQTNYLSMDRQTIIEQIINKI